MLGKKKKINQQPTDRKLSFIYIKPETPLSKNGKHHGNKWTENLICTIINWAWKKNQSKFVFLTSIWTYTCAGKSSLLMKLAREDKSIFSS